MQADGVRAGLMLFLLVFFLIYGGLHLYIFVKIKYALSPGTKGQLAVVTFFVIMVIAPVVIRILERTGYETLARALSYIGYTWTGIAFLFFSVAILIDVYRLCVHVMGALLPYDITAFNPSALFNFAIPLAIALSITVFGYFEAQNIRTERVTIETPKIPEDRGRITIVQISDIHLGLIVREGRLRAILEKVKAENPDILVSTGDLVDGQMCDLEKLMEMLKEITPPHGKFAVTGNHEFYAGLTQALECTRQSGFEVLRQKGVTIPGVVAIAGVDDPAGKMYGLSGPISEKELLAGFSNDVYTILLKHQPVVDEEASGYFDLQLSGHTHRGQIFPFTLITRLRYPFNSGFFALGANAHLYVSRGTGTWGPPIRFLSPPEITVIELVSPAYGK